VPAVRVDTCQQVRARIAQLREASLLEGGGQMPHIAGAVRGCGRTAEAAMRSR